MGKGDHVRISPGGRTPFIIRSRYTKTTRSSLVLSGSNFAWTSLDTDELLGDCYVQGLKDGEAMKRSHENLEGCYPIETKSRDSIGKYTHYFRMERDGSHQNHDERLTEDGARGEREARNWYYSAETWRHENSNLWDQPEEAKVRLWNGDQPKWQIARRDHDNLNRSWAAVGETWQSALRGWRRLKDFGRETKFDWKHILQEWHSCLQSWNFAVQTWKNAKLSSQHILKACNKDIQDLCGLEKNLIAYAFEDIERRYKLLSGQHLEALVSKGDWQPVIAEWREFAEQERQQIILWQELTDGRKCVQETEAKLDKIFQNRAEVTTLPSELDEEELRQKMTE
ncbi:hypothetical protein ETB97_008483 [Aspergillus alliaceus]|uniref:Uncharacterized protein n=1 Tax=Petromyces alliaceus TaxID=209559 RepID=A0A8H6E9Y3_PETAA|nr:hypothetical protein ETB97_008483 [Aspergillus burnettii]